MYITRHQLFQFQKKYRKKYPYIDVDVKQSSTKPYNLEIIVITILLINYANSYAELKTHVRYQ